MGRHFYCPRSVFYSVLPIAHAARQKTPASAGERRHLRVRCSHHRHLVDDRAQRSHKRILCGLAGIRCIFWNRRYLVRSVLEDFGKETAGTADGSAICTRCARMKTNIDSASSETRAASVERPNTIDEQGREATNHAHEP